ncbi:hypothetical protein Acy02nite_88900 [Actinoplanes cyaneus]|uniref:Glycosyltransferase 2-like domain-containing protein n=1 Tax=Actinoplanes cyaneus TaxID=52696 RepID=A0A919IRU8_9ACTN|nr:glycosyltransferase family 2 protein [Actinoplanes cyaneus]MCW2144278.1 Glycosyl transferase family 2 [Actinoplanes cyaneus]GID71009.1 hypothetical protein Acy02nite_88900 [Actinoplanes cyaneus]
MDVSVIVPTRDKARYIERTLESLINQKTTAAYEVVVVDNGSTDETADVADRYHRLDERVRAITVPEPGRSTARNAGITAARGAVVLFIDDDCICPPDLLQSHADLHRTPETVVLGARREVFSLVPVDETLAAAVQRSGARLDDRLTVTGDYPAAHLWDVWDIRHRFPAIAAASGTWPTTDDTVEHLRLVESGASAAPWLGFTSCHASLPAWLCRDVGMFDGGFQGWGEEDAELGYRLWRAGATFRALPGVSVYHQAHPRRRRQDTQSWFRNYVRATEKHPGPDWHLRWRLSLGYITPIQYEETMREVLAGDTRRAASIRKQYETFVRLWPGMQYGAGLKPARAVAVSS